MKKNSKYKFSGKDRYEKRRALGLCLHCEGELAVGVVCLDCWFRQTAWNHLGSTTLGPQLRALWDSQDGLCAYTKKTLIPGPRSVGNASLDHKVPPSRGGSDGIENLQWVLCTVNRMKTDMTEEEFFDLCRIVLSNRSVSTG